MSVRVAVIVLLLVAAGAPAATEKDVIAAYNRGNQLAADGKYDEADREYQRCLELCRAVYGGEFNGNTAVLYMAIGDLYETQAKWDDADKAYARCLAIREKVNGANHPEVARPLRGLASVARGRGKPADAEKLLGRALAVEEKGPPTASLGATLNDLGITASFQDKYEDAARYHRRALEVRQKADGMESTQAGQSWNNLGLALHNLDRHAEAEEALTKGLRIREKVKGPDHPTTAESIHNLGILLHDLGKYAEAEELHRRALKIRETKLSFDHPATANSLNSLAIVLMDRGKYDDAEKAFRRALAIREKAFGPESGLAADTLNNQAMLEKARGRFGEAEKLYNQALVVGEKAYGPESEAVATKANNLANLLSDLGRYGDAEALYRRGLAIREKIYPPEHHGVADSLTNLGGLLTIRGRSADARPLLERALAIREKVYDPAHPKVGEAATNLAIVLARLGERREAEPLYRRALAVAEKVHGKDHQQYGSAVYNLAGFEYDAAHYAEAEAGYREALQVFEKALGPQHPHVGDVLNNLANALKGQGKADAARPFRERAQAITAKAFGADSAAAAVGLNNLAVDAWMARDFAEAARRFDEIRRTARRFLLRELPYLSADEQRAYMAQTEFDQFARCLTLGRDRAADPEIVARTAEWLVNGKAVALEARTLRARIDREVTDPAGRALVGEIADLRAREAALALQGSGPATPELRKQREDLQTRRRELETKLAEAGGPAAGLFRPWVDLDAVRKAVPTDGVLVDIARFHPARLSANDAGPAWEPDHYVAWLIPPAGRGAVAVVDLGDADAIDRAVVGARSAVAGGSTRAREVGEPKAETEANDALAKLADKVLTPLRPHLKGVKTLVLSPDGQLWLAPWAALPAGDGKYLVETLTIRHVLSGRDLVPPPASKKYDTSAPLILADPDYDGPPAAGSGLAGREFKGHLGDIDAVFAFAPGGKFTVKVPDGQALGTGTWKQDGNTVEMDTTTATYTGKVAGTRLEGERRLKGKKLPPTAFAVDLGAEAGTMPRPIRTGLPKVPRLDLTAVEAEAAAGRLKALTGLAAVIRLGAEATEAAVKAAARPRVLVLATHGFFLPPPKASPKGDDPLARAGVLLAGCNRRDPLKPGEEDGVLSGLEVLGLDLRGTELVVLSACETGVGDATAGDGVAGLRQAFELAGAADVLASLWAVPDTETVSLMGGFYDRWAAGADRAAALAQAQRDLITARRRARAAAHPYYWAAFTLTGRVPN